MKRLMTDRSRFLVVLAIALAAVTIFAVRSNTQIAEADHTGGSSGFTADLLMLDTTLETHGGSQTPVEVEQAALLSLTVDVVSAATWGTMTAADFSHYKALILGDPHCKTSTSGTISAAEANRSVWGPEVTGNVVVIGTDPDFHRTQGGAALTKSGLAFAAAEAGKTGAYITLSCYYFNVPTSTPVPVPVLDQFGSFTVHGQTVPGGTSCPADSHIVATHPALATLTDADLSNWGCSFHEGFVLPLPSDFLVLAIALDVPSTFVAADGTSGTPYIIARGVEVISDIDLAPDGVVNSVGTSHTVTATVTTDDPTAGTPIVGTTVTFTVISGPHVGTTGTGVTDSSGVATFTYTGTSAGVDTIEATFVDSTGTTQTSNTVEKIWEEPPFEIEKTLLGVDGDLITVCDEPDDCVVETDCTEIGIYLPEATLCVFEIAYTGPTAAKVIDTVPAEFECVKLVPTAGTATCSKKGKSNKAANRIEWDVPAGSSTLTVVIQTVASPGKGHAKKGETVFKPTSCGSLTINDGATAFEVDPVTGELVLVEVLDPVTGEITLEPVVIVGPSNSLVVEAVEGAKPCEEG